MGAFSDSVYNIGMKRTVLSGADHYSSSDNGRRTVQKYRTVMFAGIVFLVLAACVSLCMGRYAIPVQTVWKELIGQGEPGSSIHTILFNVRLPRILLSVLAGSGLAVSGLAFQCLFSNPLATPDTLGTADGSSFGACLGILLGFPQAGIQQISLLMGAAAVGLVFLITGRSERSRTGSMVYVILAGLVISSLFQALVSVTKFTADPLDQLPQITFWLLGSFSSVTWQSMLTAAPLILVGIILLTALRFRLNVLSLSREEAESLGLNLPLVRALVILAASAITAAVVSVCGVIGWVGLLVPHICRMLVGNDTMRCEPACVLIGGLFMLVTDTFARCVSASEIPVSILTALVGAPVFILLLRRTGGIHA